MSQVIDEKVVSLELDNRDFEKNSEKSMRTIDRLKQSLNFDKVGKSLDGLNDAAKKVDMSSISEGADTVGLRFSAMYSIADQALRNITNSAMIAGKRLISSLTIDPVKTGLQEYETQLGAIQTILSNTKAKGSTLDDVNNALDELNKYADQTIYNFTEMTKNIGTFTAAGVDLDTSVSAIKGIANLAAVSGSTSQQASTAMYQLSQALASGTVKLMDWNSVVNAGMGGEVFQNALKETAKLHGVAIDQIIEDQGSFRESLSEGWLTSEILTDTLKKFTYSAKEGTEEWNKLRDSLMAEGYTEKQAEEIIELGNMATSAATEVKTASQMIDVMKESVQSGWAQTWEIVFGDFEEAKSRWTKYSTLFTDLLGQSAKNRNDLLGGALNTGWDQLLGAGIFDEKGLSNFLNGAVLKKEGKSIDDLAISGESLSDTISRLANDGVITTDMLSQSINSLTKEYDGYNEVQLKNSGVTREQIDDLKKLNEQFQNGTISLEEFMDKIKRKSGRDLLFESFENIAKSIRNVIKPIKDAWGEIFSIDSAQLYGIINSFHSFTEKLVTFTENNMENLKRTFKGLFAVVDIAWTVIKTLGGIIIDVIGLFVPLGSGILAVTGNFGDFLVSLRKTIKESTSLKKFATNVVSAVSSIINVFANFGNSIKQSLESSGISSFVDFLTKAWNVISTVFGHIISAIQAVGGSIFETITGSGIQTILELLQAGTLVAIFKVVKDALGNVSGIIDNFNEILGSVTETLQAFQSSIKAKTIESISTSMLMLAVAILAISLVDKEKLERSLAAITMLFVGLMATLSMVTDLPKAVISGGTIMAIAGAILILAAALNKLGNLTSDDLVTSILGMTACIVALTGTLKALSLIKSESKMATEGAKQLFKISLALIPSIYVIKQLSDIYWKDMLFGISGMTLALVALTGVLKVLSLIKSETKMATEGAKQLFKISLALIPLALAVKMIAAVDWEGIKKAGVVMAAGLSGMIVALGVVVTIDKLSKKVEKAGNFKVVVGKCVQLTLIAGALGLLAITLRIIAKLDWEDIAKGLISMTFMVGILTTGLRSIAKIDDSSTMGSILTVMTMAVSIKILAGTLNELGQLNWNSIGKGIVAMAGTMAVLAIGLASISKISSSMSLFMGDGVTGSLLGATKNVSMIKNAAALLVLATSIKFLSSAIADLGKLSWGSIAKGLTAITGTMLILVGISKLLTFGAAGLMSMAGAITLLGLSCLAAGGGIALMATGLSMLGDSVGDAIKSLCEAIIVSADSIGKAISTLIVSLLNSLVEVSDKIVSSLLSIILNSMNELRQFIPDIARAFMDLLIGVTDELINFMPEIVNLVTNLLNTLFDSVGDVLSQIDTTALLKGSAAIAILASMMLMLSKIGIKMIPKALLGVVGIAAVVTALGAMFGGLSKIPGLSDLIADGGSLLNSLGLAIGNFFGGFVAGLTIGSTSGIQQGVDMLKILCSPDVILSLGMLAGLMGVLGLVARMAGKFDNIILGTVGLIGVLSAVTVVVAGLAALTNAEKDTQELMEGVAILTLLCSPDVITSLASLSILAGILGIIGYISKNIVTGAAALVVTVAAVALIAGAFGLLAENTDATGYMAKGIDVLLLLCSKEVLIGLTMLSGLMAILGIVGFLASTAITGAVALMGVITIIGACLAAFGALAQIPGLTWLIEEGSEMFELIGTAIGKFVGGIVGGIAQGVTSSLPTIATDLSNFMTNLQPFIKGISSISPETAEGALHLAATILAITAASVINGIFGWLTGGLDVATFATQLTAFGVGLSNFSEAVVNVNGERVKMAAEAGKILMDCIDDIPRTGGWFQAIFGEVGIETVANQLGALGSGIAAFGAAVVDIDGGKIKAGAEAGKDLMTCISKMPKTGGWWQSVFGEVQPGVFGTQIAGLGSGIAAFGEAVSNVNKETITAGSESAKILIAALGNVGNNSGWTVAVKEFFSGKIDWKEFKTNMSNLGEGTKAFNDKVTGITPAKTKTGAEACSILINSVNNLPTDGGIWDMDMATLKTKFKGLGEAISSYATSSDGITIEQINAVNAKLSSINSALSNFSTAGIDSIVDSFKSAPNDIKSAINTALDSAITQVEGYYDNFKKVGGKIIEKFVEGINKDKTSAKTAVGKIVEGAAEKAGSKTYYNEFYDAGEYMAEGFVDGIEDYIDDAAQAAAKMAAAAIKAAEEELDENSPSKVFYGIGEFAGIAFVNSFEDYEVDSYDAGASMANQAIEGLRKIISNIGKVVEDEINTQPTITPVLNLDELHNGVNSINDMFGMNPSVGVMSKVGSINSAMNSIQNRGNDDVISAIGDLKKSLDNASRDTYNINGVTYDDGSQLQTAIETIVRAARIERRR